MPRYHFHIDGEHHRLDMEDVAMSNLAEAQEHAEQLALTLAKSNPHLRQLIVVVRDEFRREVCRVPLEEKKPIH